MSANTLPKFLKDETGFCYTATPHLANLQHLTPWDGAIDEHGFAVNETVEVVPAAKPAAKPKTKAAE